MPVKEEHKKRIALEARPLLSQEVSAARLVLCKTEQNHAACGMVTTYLNKSNAARRCVWVMQVPGGISCVVVLLLFSVCLWLFRVLFVWFFFNLQ